MEDKLRLLKIAKAFLLVILLGQIQAFKLFEKNPTSPAYNIT